MAFKLNAILHINANDVKKKTRGKYMLKSLARHGEQSSTHFGDRCPMYATVLKMIWVYGNCQRAKRGTNAEPCCSDAPLND